VGLTGEELTNESRHIYRLFPVNTTNRRERLGCLKTVNRKGREERIIYQEEQEGPGRGRIVCQEVFWNVFFLFLPVLPGEKFFSTRKSRKRLEETGGSH
jgi:hypothetical protein